MTECRHYFVSGRVQGVFYRGSAEQKANRLGLTGWVRNLGDGRVEAVACGSPESLSEFETWLRRGPRAARVEHVAIEPIAPQGLTDFRVR